MTPGLWSLLLFAAPGFPLLLATVWPIPALRRLALPLAPWAAAPALVLALAVGLAGGPGELEGASAALPAFFTGLRLAVDGVGWAFLLLTALLWLAAGAFARSYHATDPRRSGFFGFFVLTMAGNLGLAVAADILSFYLFFAVMTFSAYGLVVHRRDGEALRAGRIYIVLAVLAELALLIGIFSLGAAADGVPAFGTEVGSAWRTLAADPGSLSVPLVASLLVAGFAVKAGVAPLHIWLPLAHPVAPTAASALLSGAMIKGGLLGWLRFLPDDLALPALGAALMVGGTATAFYGVAIGLAQDEAKTVLAYSSVSQMGYMALGTGIVLWAPELGPPALAGVVLYAVHHGMAKGALFLSVGVADRWPGRAAASGYGRPSRRRMARTAAILGGAALPALALTGAPLTTGARAKALLKTGLEELGGTWHTAMDVLLPVAAFGTTLLMARFLVTLWHREASAATGSAAGERPSGAAPKAPAGLLLPWAALVAAGLAGVVWLPWLLPDPAAVEVPRALYGIVAALLPVLGGAMVAWGVYHGHRRLGRWVRLRVPAGDLLVPLERGAERALALVSQEGAVRRATEAAARIRESQRRIGGLAGWVAERDVFLARGALFGAFVLGLAVLLVAVALR